MIPLAYILNYGIYIGLLPVFDLDLQYCNFVFLILFWSPMQCDTMSLLCIDMISPASTCISRKSHPKMAGISWLCPVVWAWAVPKPLRRQGFFGQLGEAYGKWGHLFYWGQLLDWNLFNWMNDVYISFIYLSICLSVCFPVCLSPYLSIRLPLCQIYSKSKFLSNHWCYLILSNLSM